MLITCRSLVVYEGTGGIGGYSEERLLGHHPGAGQRVEPVCVAIFAAGIAIGIEERASRQRQSFCARSTVDNLVSARNRQSRALADPVWRLTLSTAGRPR